MFQTADEIQEIQWPTAEVSGGSFDAQFIELPKGL